MKLKIHEIAQAVGAKNDISQLKDTPINTIEFDSRLIKEGDLFLPLKGNRDGHDFIPVAFENGALITFSEKEVDYPHLLVEDTLLAFQTLAKYYLEKMAVSVIAVTGSNGKTTTKDMIAAILSTTFSTYKTQGNYNNEIGLPYTILHMPDNTEKLVLEMGQDHLGDIHLLSTIAKPDISVVTLIGEAHLAFFGSRKKIAKGKLQIADGMKEKGLLLVPNDPILEDFLPNNQEVIKFGPETDLAVNNLKEYKDYLTFSLNFIDGEIYLPVTGKYNATNAMVAAYVASRLGVSDVKIKSALKNIILTKNRTQWKKAKNGADILSDIYNANPTAMRLILETFSSLEKPENSKKIVVLADMKELGEASKSLHEKIITSLNPDQLDDVYFYGEEIYPLYQLALKKFPEERVVFFSKNNLVDEISQLIERVKERLEPQDQILLKGSHSMNLEKLIEAIE
ncbi:UDP-N-acetylmuramoyl-tripeptide--D-alanyl-D-alanine ligase [Streptococcus pacificus]|uniref:UDP-N-acetylmuramoyl-tripeptide--D-alanyl-D-alanine ligase n=1 Tax=Streptococcus pacificus TaxID=2740577 RepID=A0ABS0ZHB0_9STRE|nr:UDP-N-acetylmuramoyl-tripeptide--D-alanyl-D-alanine ligase [Streptococcus pacificus]MBJ8325367.1 UDP-N-acetylmuramoyl-tripeptide--D-alanyl-D-alanine ligase [Streptococcus pacificus]